jgi:hypothetical protein
MGSLSVTVGHCRSLSVSVARPAPPRRSRPTGEGHYNGYEYGTVVSGSAFCRRAIVPRPMPRRSATTRNDKARLVDFLLHETPSALRRAAATLRW